MTWFTWTPLELAANVMTAICIFLAGRNNVHTWWTGIVATVLFAVLFYQNQLYADVTLQLFFVVTGFIGWRTWVQRRELHDISNTEGYVEFQEKISETKITYASREQLMNMGVFAVVIAALYGFILHSYTDAYAPWIDSTVLTFSVVGQLLLMQRRVQNWPVWLLVNTLSVPLYWSRELYMTSVLYGFFWVNALISWRTWVRLESEQ